jgi:hypothetical protein
MKNAIVALSVLGGGVLIGWLIFGLGGKAGDITIGFLLGVVAVIFAGTWYHGMESKDG